MGKGSSTTTQNNSPPPQYVAGYSNALSQAQQVAGTPYSNYPGQLVAGLSPDQQAGISQTEQVASPGTYAPYLNSAADYISQSQAPVMTGQVQGLVNQATNGGIQTAANQGVAGIQTAEGGLNPGAIQEFEDPYTSSVVNATQAEFNNQNAQQAAQLAGNSISQGAFGGNREQVAQGVLAGQQQLAEAPQIASLENTGYQTALGAAESQASLGMQGATAAGQLGLTGAAQQAAENLQGASTELGANEAQGWLASQGGYGMANLGNEAETLGLEGANAELGVGGLEQQEAQENLNVPYEEYEAAQAYPFQTTGWLANIAEGLGSNAGGTGSTTSSAPSAASEYAGLGAAGIGALGESGAFNGLFGGSAAASDAAGNLAGEAADLGVPADEMGAYEGLNSIGNRGGSIENIAKQGRASGGATMGMRPIHWKGPIHFAARAGQHLDSGGSVGDDDTDLAQEMIYNQMAQSLGNARGGRIPHRAIGGTSPMGDTAPMGSASPVGSGAASGNGIPTISVNVPSGTGGGSNLLTRNYGSTSTTTPDAGNAVGTDVGIALDVAKIASMFANRGGRIPHRASGGVQPVPQIGTNGGVTMVMPTSGGTPVPQLPTTPTTTMGNGSTGGGGIQAVNNYLAQQKAGTSTAAPPVYTPPAPAPAATQQQPLTQAQIDAQNLLISPEWVGGAGGGYADGGRIHRDDGGGMPDDDDDVPDTTGNGPPPPPQQTMGMPAPQQGQQRPTRTGDPWRALMMAGLGMAGGSSPYAAVNIGQGALKGLQLYEEDQDKRDAMAQRQSQTNALNAYREQEGQIAQKKLKDTESQNDIKDKQDAQKLQAYFARVKDEISNDDARTGQGAARVGIEAGNESINQKRYELEAGKQEPLPEPLANGDIGMRDPSGRITDTGQKMGNRPAPVNPNAVTPEARVNALRSNIYSRTYNSALANGKTPQEAAQIANTATGNAMNPQAGSPAQNDPLGIRLPQ